MSDFDASPDAQNWFNGTNVEVRVSRFACIDLQLAVGLMAGSTFTSCPPLGRCKETR